MDIAFRKTIPVTSDFYTTGGDITITLLGAQSFTWNVKRSLIKIMRAKSKKSQQTAATDKPARIVIDLNRIEETCALTGWIEDDSTSTAWEKFWQLRAMCTGGNNVGEGSRLKSFRIGDKLIGDGTGGTIDMPAFIEDVTAKYNPQDATDVETRFTDANGNNVNDIARIEITITLFFGTEK